MRREEDTIILYYFEKTFKKSYKKIDFSRNKDEATVVSHLLERENDA